MKHGLVRTTLSIEPMEVNYNPMTGRFVSPRGQVFGWDRVVEVIEGDFSR